MNDQIHADTRVSPQEVTLLVGYLAWRVFVAEANISVLSGIRTPVVQATIASHINWHI
jgi:hypothetical protein